MLTNLKFIPGSVWLIGFISFMNDFASEMIYPLIPFYLATTLLSGPKILGLIEGIAEATSSLFKLVSGVLFDKFHNARLWMLVGYSFAGFGRPLLAFANSWIWILSIRFVDRIGKGLRSSPRDALLAFSVSEKQRGLAFGLHRSFDNAGAVLGPLVATFLLFMGMPLEDVFIWSLVPAIIAICLTFLIIEPKNKVAPSFEKFSWSLKGLSQDFKKYLCVIALFTLGNSSDMFLLLRAKELGVPLEQIPLLWAAVSFITAILGTPLSALSDRFDRKLFILMAWFAFSCVYFCMGLDGVTVPILFGLFALYGIFKAATEGVEKALVADMAPVNLTGTAFGWFNLISGVMLLPASFIFGWLYEIHGPLYAFSFSATLAGSSALLMFTWIYKKRVISQ